MWPFDRKKKQDDPDDTEDNDILGPLGLNARSLQNVTVIADLKRDVEDIKAAVNRIADALDPQNSEGQ